MKQKENTFYYNFEVSLFSVSFEKVQRISFMPFYLKSKYTKCAVWKKSRFSGF